MAHFIHEIIMIIITMIMIMIIDNCVARVLTSLFGIVGEFLRAPEKFELGLISRLGNSFRAPSHSIV